MPFLPPLTEAQASTPITSAKSYGQAYKISCIFIGTSQQPPQSFYASPFPSPFVVMQMSHTNVNQHNHTGLIGEFLSLLHAKNLSSNMQSLMITPNNLKK
jgi:hypothetical protein